jgi:hypothetical protein
MPLIWVNSTVQFAQMIAEYTAARVIKEIRRMGGQVMATYEDLEAAITAQFETLSPAVNDVQGKIRDLADLVKNGASSEALSQAITELNSNTSVLASGLKAAMEDPATPDPTVPVPEPENPLPPLPGQAEEENPAPADGNDGTQTDNA